ncbi:hypothetical protein M422DRAFT_254479 [Sphaerobolus stellatus SS14]|uniref:Unplaced genomic scaffold SPHSTscaffold_55, whole genome shotgun sequence n=1 Tax=Sphaerobolus stellatus (strain SS14) TaxID=990650 RepID=A0A0C9V639_SPHS4|nr:hypothetical protein M422DRAFT_254479 [Sphaerobolus stellatus SS14]
MERDAFFHPPPPLPSLNTSFFTSPCQAAAEQLIATETGAAALITLLPSLPLPVPAPLRPTAPLSTLAPTTTHVTIHVPAPLSFQTIPPAVAPVTPRQTVQFVSTTPQSAF